MQLFLSFATVLHRQINLHSVDYERNNFPLLGLVSRARGIKLGIHPNQIDYSGLDAWALNIKDLIISGLDHHIIALPDKYTIIKLRPPHCATG